MYISSMSKLRKSFWYSVSLFVLIYGRGVGISESSSKNLIMLLGLSLLIFSCIKKSKEKTNIPYYTLVPIPLLALYIAGEAGREGLLYIFFFSSYTALYSLKEDMKYFIFPPLLSVLILLVYISIGGYQYSPIEILSAAAISFFDLLFIYLISSFFTFAKKLREDRNTSFTAS